MVYEEFLLFQLKMQMFRKINREQSAGETLHFKEEDVQKFISSLPFPLTGAQGRVTQEILNDMSSPYRMNRLLQGDVGSGKTVVAKNRTVCAYSIGHTGSTDGADRDTGRTTFSIPR